MVSHYRAWTLLLHQTESVWTQLKHFAQGSWGSCKFSSRKLRLSLLLQNLLRQQERPGDPVVHHGRLGGRRDDPVKASAAFSDPTVRVGLGHWHAVLRLSSLLPSCSASSHASGEQTSIFSNIPQGH